MLSFKHSPPLSTVEASMSLFLFKQSLVSPESIFNKFSNAKTSVFSFSPVNISLLTVLTCVVSPEHKQVVSLLLTESGHLLDAVALSMLESINWWECFEQDCCSETEFTGNSEHKCCPESDTQTRSSTITGLS
ncbi:LOW QUALITY PROTEIN: hypothetical protein TorRG33x02_126000 [Trema orientale]|uniref:Uncharacterized protein n=1 Tax=Trema orientale TaxID=63057 RepID=A0A2P5F1A0_TREOI|nr:LOW QUALITY PROTEIN: hypothetical protein TorRG33x02_126000 [Trema orientale]